MKRKILCGILLVFVCCPLLFTSCGDSGKQRSAGPDELVIVAHVTTTPEFLDDMTQAFDAVVKGTRKEPGNISYILYQDVNNPLKFTFVEIWKSQAAIDAHNSSVHFREFAKAIEGKASLEIHTVRQKF